MRERRRPSLTERSRFSIGSLWKQHLGLTLQERVRSGRLRLDDRVDRWLPELASAPCARATLEQLVHMTSGLPYVISLSDNVRTQLARRRQALGGACWPRSTRAPAWSTPASWWAHASSRQSCVYPPAQALRLGLLDEVVASEAEARAMAEPFTSSPRDAYVAAKLRK